MRLACRVSDVTVRAYKPPRDYSPKGLTSIYRHKRHASRGNGRYAGWLGLSRLRLVVESTLSGQNALQGSLVALWAIRRCW